MFFRDDSTPVHFALEEDGDLIAAYINNFLDKQVKKMCVAQALGT